MKFIDIHTHNCNSKDLSILSCNTKAVDTHLCSIGIHPRDITPYWKAQFNEMITIAENKNIVAIGECGFDFLKSTISHELQQEVFNAHIEISESVKKPLIIHLVKGQEALIEVAKKSRHRQAWIIHGFRGKPEQAQQLLSQGIYLSFGKYFNEKSVAIAPIDRIFIETDESNENIENIYNRIAKIKGIESDELVSRIYENIMHCKISLSNRILKTS